MRETDVAASATTARRIKDKDIICSHWFGEGFGQPSGRIDVLQVR